MQLWQDPFVHFIAGCFLIPPLWDKMGFKELMGFYLHWTMVVVAIGIFLTVKITQGTKKKGAAPVGCCDGWVARWYLLNGWVIHGLMDGAVGVFKAHPVYADHYNQLDKRYGSALGSALGVYVHTISSVELFVYTPICIYLYYAIHHGKSCRDALEIVTTTLQLFGTVLYVFPEVWQGMPSFTVDYKLEFSLVMLKDFWFAFVIGNIVYLTVPTYLLFKAIARTKAAAAATAPTQPSQVDAEIEDVVRSTRSASQKKSPSKAKSEAAPAEEEEEEEAPKKRLSRTSTTSRSSGTVKRASSSRKKK